MPSGAAGVGGLLAAAAAFFAVDQAAKNNPELLNGGGNDNAHGVSRRPNPATMATREAVKSTAREETAASSLSSSTSAASSSKFAPPPNSATRSVPGGLGTFNFGQFQNYITSFGLPSDENVAVAPNEAYVSSFSTRLRIPNWVLERVENPKTAKAKAAAGDSETGGAAGNRANSKFYTNTSIYEPFRATNPDYATLPGFSRGHLAAAQFHKDSQIAMDATFDLSRNIVPQEMSVNACDWFRVEQMSKALSKDFDVSWILTGPLFMPKWTGAGGAAVPSASRARKIVSYEVIGDHEVAVPSHLFKCFFGERQTTPMSTPTVAVGCFVIPNAPVPDERPLTAFEVPPAQLERLTGLRLGPAATVGLPSSGFFGANRPSASTEDAAATASTAITRATSVYGLCAKHKCEGSYGSFSRSYRNIGRLRTASSMAELQQQWDAIDPAAKTDGALAKEFEARKKSLAGL